MSQAVYIFLGAGLGGLMRYGVSSASLRLFGQGFPMGTLLVNVVGCFLMGLVSGYFIGKADVHAPLRPFLTTGLLGGFTTFSAFSLEVIAMAQRGETGLAAAYVLLSVSLSVVGLALGLWLMR